MSLLSSLALAPLPWPWDAHAPRQTLALEDLTLSLPLWSLLTTMRMPEGNIALSYTHSKVQPTQRLWVPCSLGQTLPKLLPSFYTDWACSHCPGNVYRAWVQ